MILLSIAFFYITKRYVSYMIYICISIKRIHIIIIINVELLFCIMDKTFRSFSFRSTSDYYDVNQTVTMYCAYCPALHSHLEIKHCIWLEYILY